MSKSNRPLTGAKGKPAPGKPTGVDKSKQKTQELDGLKKENADLRKKLKESEASNKLLSKYYTPEAPERLKITDMSDDTFFKDAFENAMARLKQYDSGENVNTADKEQMQSEIKKLKDDVEKLKNQNSSLQQDCNRHIRDLEDLKKEKNTLEEKLTAKDNERNDGRKSQSQQELAELKVQMGELNKKKEQLEQELSDQKINSNVQKETVQKLKEEMNNMRKSMAESVQKSERANEELEKRQTEWDTNVREKDKEIKKLLEENRLLKEEKEKLNQKEKTFQKEKSSLLDQGPTEAPLPSQARVKEMEDQIQKQSKDLAQAKAEIDSLKSDKAELKKSLAEAKAEIDSLKRDKAELENKCHDAFTKLEAKDKYVKDEIKKQKDILERKERTINELQKEKSMKVVDTGNDKQKALDEKEKELKMAKEELNKIKSQLDKAQKKIDSVTAEKEELSRSCHDAFKKIQEKEKYVEEQTSKQKELLERKDNTINQLRREASMNIGMGGNEDLKKTLDQKEKELTKIKEDLNDAKTEIAALKKQTRPTVSNREQDLQEEVDTLKARLSKMAGAQLMDNNPNIADLSDENRATKLGERYSELYDNEWTDAYEETESSGKGEKECIKYLLDMLQDVNKLCGELSVKHMKNLRTSALSIPGCKSPTNDNEIAVTKQRQLKELHKAFATDILPHVKEYCKKELKTHFQGKPNTQTFFEACVELCWYMSVQDPPVVLQKPPGSGSALNTDVYRNYTKTGKNIDYVVWPTMLLHENGPILLKGVAQGK